MKNSSILLTLGVLVLLVLGTAVVFFSYTRTTLQGVPNMAPAREEKASMANPASINCEEKGGSLMLKKRPDGGEYGVCDFGDDMQCEEWALMRGECPVGGIKTVGYDTEAEIYCAITGGQTLAVEDATCTLPNGTVCNAGEYFRGSCPSQ